MKKGAPANDVDSYLATLPDDQRLTLEKIRKAIKAAAPKAEEAISYRIPVFKYHGPLVFFAAFVNHCSLFVPGKEAILKPFRSELKPFKTSGATIHFSPENPLPASLVKKIVKARISANERRGNLQRKKR
ncbi:MAG TPA: DUF1801 domain-containing protein [Candidatus Limnocylindrales bacterium]|nr:DUF1801 domain-containing protein [Candidatus Limnocylindrales bacterium]